MIESAAQVAAWIAGIGAGVFVLFKFFVATRKLFSFLDEVTGEPAAFGRPAKPGLVEKVDLISAEQAAHTEQIQRILHEVYPNSGGSLRDAVDRLERASAPSPVQVNVNPPKEG